MAYMNFRSILCFHEEGYILRLSDSREMLLPNLVYLTSDLKYHVADLVKVLLY